MNPNCNILIMPSQPIVGEIISYRLQLLGWNTHIVFTESELKAYLDDQLPHLFMIDLDLTEVSGLSIVERLSSDEGTAQAPILCMSEEGDLAIAEQAWRSGARDFLVIPFDPLLMEEKVDTLLTATAEQRQSRDRSVPAASKVELLHG